MNSIFKLVITATATIALTSASQGQVTINQPKVVDDEFANDQSIISINVPAGLSAGGAVVDTETILIDVAVHDAADALQGAPAPAQINTGVAYVDGTGNNVSIDLSTIDFTGIAGWPTTGWIIKVTATSATGTGLTVVFNAGDESLDETLLLDAMVPTLLQFKVTANMAFATFSEPINSDNDVAVPPNTNDTELVINGGSFDFNDFQVSTISSFTGTEVAPTFLTGEAYAGTNNNMIIFNRGASSTAVGGDFIRLNFDNVPSIQHDLFDVVGNAGTNTAVQIQAVAALDATSAEFITSVNPGAGGGGATETALRVTFNNTIADPGDAADYTLLLDGIVTGDFSLANPVIDGMDPSSVLLDVIADPNFGIESDARSTASLGDATGIFTVRVVADSGGAEITDDYLQSITVADDVVVADKIEPNLIVIGMPGSGGFEDVNTVDGRQDSAILVFDEPMSAPAAITGFTITMQDAVPVKPIDQVAANGTLVGSSTVEDGGTPANNEIPIIGVTLASIDFDADGTITDRETNNALRISYNPLTFDWDHDGAVGLALDANEPIPGTGDPGVIMIDYTVSTNEVKDAATNDYSNGATDIAELTVTDYASPIIALALILDGDNTNNPDPTADITVGDNNEQLFAEQFPGGTPVLGDIGQNLDARRVVLAFSENMNPLSNTILEENVSVAATALIAAADNFGTFGFHDTDNRLTLRNSGSDTAFDVAAAVAIITGSKIEDTAGLESTGSGTTTDARAPYVPLQGPITPGGDPVHGAFTIDTDGDGFADEIHITMTQPIDAATLTLVPPDFTLSPGTMTAIALNPLNSSLIVLTLTDGVVADNVTITVTYNGVADTTRIASDSGNGGTGVAVSAVDSAFVANPIPSVTNPTDNVAIMDIVGVGTMGGIPLPAGTKIIAMVATPTVRSINAEHNTNFFTARDTTSITAWTNWLLGIGGAEFIYLGRDASNTQTYSNSKALADVNNASTLEDVIELIINARLLTKITFTGTGENRSTDRLSRGTIELCWDVLRSGDGTTADFYASGFVFGGNPILSMTIITSGDGSYGLHVSAPISDFDGRSNLNSIDLPVILIAELTNGSRFPLSSLVASINGAPVLFSPNNRTRNSDLTAVNATVFDFELDDVGAISAYPGWNLLGFNRASGFAKTTSNRPALPAGIAAADIVIGTNIPFADALDQFVYFDDTTPDGVWTRTEDANFQNIIIDHDCFSNFAFTMTSFGVQAGSKITNLVGGYGLGFFVNETNTYGIFQFGPMRTGSDYFTASFPFPKTSTTQGWGLFSAPSASTTTALKAANAEFDFLIQFRNNGSGFEVMSIDLDAPSGSDNVNDATDVNAGEASFYHTK